MKDLENQLALITGGGSGICFAFAKRIHADGCRLVLADLELHSQAQAWIDALTAADKERVAFCRVDVTDWAQLEGAFNFCAKRFNEVPNVIVPGAGVYEPSSHSFWDDSDSGSRYKVLDINLTHPIKMTRIAVRKLVNAQKAGTIIHLSSIAGQRSSIVTPLYTASKHGVNSLIRGMAPLQALSNIRVVGVAPGTVATPLFLEKPEASRFLDLDKDYLLPPDSVANAMFSMLTKPDEYAGGTVLEICHEDKWRKVSLLNDPGPEGPASFTSKKKEAVSDIMKYLQPLDHELNGFSAREFVTD